MPIINYDDIIKQGDPLAILKKSVKETQRAVDDLTKSNQALNQVLNLVKKTNDGSEAKQLVSVNEKLIKSNLKLKEAKTANMRASEALLKANAKLAQAQTKEAQEVALVNEKIRQQNKILRDNAKESLGLKNRLGAITKQILSAAGIVGAVDLLIKGFTELRERMLALDKISRQVQNTFDVTQVRAKRLSSTILAIAKNFDEDYNEVLQAANAVSKEFGINAEQSLALIEDGFRKGSNNSGEFLDILKEYPVQLKSVGLNAKESFAIINQQVKAGVYSDKGIDAIKEAGISIRENTKAYQDAIKPINSQVKAEIERERAAGNTFKAMQLIAGELKNLDVQQRQIILSDIFRGAGEDALSFVENLGELSLSLEGVKNQTSFVEEQQLRLSKVWNNFTGSVSDSGSLFSKVWGAFLGYLATVVAEFERFLDLIGLVDAKGKLNDASKGVTKYNDKIKETTTETKKLTEEEKKLYAQRKKEYESDLKFLDDYLEKLEKARREEIAFEAEKINERKASGITDLLFGTTGDTRTSTQSEIDAFKKKEQEKADVKRSIFEQNNADLLAMNQKFLDKQSSDNEEAAINDANFQKKAKEMLFESIYQVGTLYNQAQTDAKKQQIESERSIEEAILKDKLDKGLINEIQFQTKLSEINRKAREREARAEKRKAVYDILIQGAVAFVSGLVRGGLFGALKNAALVAAKAAFVAATPLPKFKEGKININGKRHSEGGILAEIEGGESVINRMGTANAPMLLDAINKGLISDKGLGLRKGQKDNLMLGLLMNGLREDNKQIIQLLSNGGYAIQKKDYVEERRSTGEIIRYVIK